MQKQYYSNSFRNYRYGTVDKIIRFTAHFFRFRAVNIIILQRLKKNKKNSMHRTTVLKLK